MVGTEAGDVDFVAGDVEAGIVLGTVLVDAALVVPAGTVLGGFGTVSVRAVSAGSVPVAMVDVVGGP